PLLPLEDLLPPPPQPARKARAARSARTPTKRVHLDLFVTRKLLPLTATAGADPPRPLADHSILTDVFLALPLVRFRIHRRMIRLRISFKCSGSTSSTTPSTPSRCVECRMRPSPSQNAMCVACVSPGSA